MAPDRKATAGAPRWVKVFGSFAILVLLFGVLMLTGIGGIHGHWRHMLSGIGLGGYLPPDGGQR